MTNRMMNMTFTTTTSNTFPSAARGRTWFGDFFAAVQQWWEYRQTVDALRQLSPRELADIGLTMAEINAIAWKATRNQSYR